MTRNDPLREPSIPRIGALPTISRDFVDRLIDWSDPGAEKPVEIWEYHMYDQAADRGLSAIFGIGRANINYWLYFEEGALYRWGPAGESKPPLRVK